MTRRQRREDSDKFVKTLERDTIGTERDTTGTERDTTGTQRRVFKIFKQAQLQETDKLKIDLNNKKGMERIQQKTLK